MAKEGSSDASRLLRATWIDLLDPTEAQRRAVGDALGLNIPDAGATSTPEIAVGVRGRHAAIISALVVGRSHGHQVRLNPVTFVLDGKRLLTIRRGDARPVRRFAAKLQDEADRLGSGSAVLVGLLEAIVGRAGELLQIAGGELEALSISVFTDEPSGTTAKSRDLRKALRTIGQNGYIVTRVRESLHSLRLSIPILRSCATIRDDDAVNAALLRIESDIGSLLDHDTHVMANATFLLDGTLGLIDIEQSGIIKIFSVAAVILMPPTLVASIYGMNFKQMPELAWSLGYPYALGLMIASAVLPYLFFRQRGWL